MRKDTNDDGPQLLAEALTLANEVLAIRERFQGNIEGLVRWRDVNGKPSEWFQVYDSRRLVHQLDLLNRLDPAEREKLDRLSNAESIVELVSNHRLDEARKLAESQLEIAQRIVPDDTARILSAQNNLANILAMQGQLPEAGELFLSVFKRVEQSVPADHPSRALSLQNLGLWHSVSGRDHIAADLVERALGIRKRIYPPDHPDVAVGMLNFATMLVGLGRVSEAASLFDDALPVLKERFGTQHQYVGACLLNLGATRYLLNRNSDAEKAYLEALNLQRMVLADNDPQLAATIYNLALLQDEMGQSDKAISGLEEALKVYRACFGNDHADIVLVMMALSSVQRRSGSAALGEETLEEALAMLERLQPGPHPLKAAILANLAGMKYQAGLLELSRSGYEEALEMRQQLFLDPHPDVAGTKHRLAHLYWEMGDRSRSSLYHLESAETRLRLLERDAVFQTEEQQLAAASDTRNSVDCQVELARLMPEQIPAVRDYWWRWKGAVTIRQQLTRRVLLDGDERDRELVRQLQDVSRQLATQFNARPLDQQQVLAWQARLDQRNQDRASVELELSSRSAEYRGGQDRLQARPDELVARLPGDCAVVDFVQQLAVNPPRYMAFVSRPGQQPRMVQLDRTSEINALVDAAHKAMSAQHSGFVLGTDSESHRLRRAVWDPILPHLDGVQTVLISPDGPLAKIPWGALPGDEPGSFLLEKFGFAIVPLPQMIAPSSAGQSRSREESVPSALLVGDIDYGAAPGVSTLEVATRSAPDDAGDGGSLRRWDKLDNAEDELASIRAKFEDQFPNARLTRLRRGEATENQFRIEAQRHLILHVVTHGYFAPELMKSAFAAERNDREDLVGLGNTGRPRFTGYPPGLLSGIVLAGANWDPQPGQDDGILTAIEIQDLDLRGVDLVTLSACETGLGQVAGGEGLLGLQRAFQVAGARTVLASLWKVPDAETQLLMQDFYRNLWEKKLGKVEALRQAQLNRIRDFRTRGGTDDLKSRSAVAPPYLWGAWVLSGDWR